MTGLATVVAGMTPVQAQSPLPDPRQTASSASPDWLAAIGSLAVPAQRRTDGRASHYLEDCSATLVSRSGSGTARIIVTAWHCLEHYRDLSRPIVFSLAARDKAALTLTARKLADGGGMHADWAILRLERGIDESTAVSLAVHPERADIAKPVSMAGYSATAGGHLRSLRYHENCRITAQQRVSADTDCVALKGSSGGAVTQRSATGTVQFSGVISEGDSIGYSRFVPVSAFRNTLNQYLR
ncbi:MAG: trypsin-like peptidase domain-containing protein [Gammaproteobacteria bacterium]|nr:trypsin-like peptidase domain-containing protein [Gammaproteobacteria bacterium]